MGGNNDDFVVHDGHVFGFDGGILACINLADGKRIWKSGRYGRGQVVLLSDQGMLLVPSEEGELAPVGDVLLVRNDHEMAAFRLSIANR